MATERKGKIAVIGVASTREENDTLRWECFPWENAQEKVNLHDFDWWVFFLPTLPAKINKETIYACLDVDHVYRALISGTKILVIGDPRDSYYVSGYGTRPFLHWTGYYFEWKHAGGDTKRVSDSSDNYRVRTYLERLSTWSYALKSSTYDPEQLGTPIVQDYLAAGKTLGLTRISLASNRNNEDISFALRLRSGSKQYPEAEAKYLSSIIFLPLGQFEPDDALRIILKEVLTISLSNEPPQWIENMIITGQDAIDAAIAKIEANIASEQATLQQALASRKQLRQCLTALYQTGIPLENTVKDLLRELGATIDEPVEKGYCDGYLKVILDGAERLAVLEIKGTDKKTFDLKGFSS